MFRTSLIIKNSMRYCYQSRTKTYRNLFYCRGYSKSSRDMIRKDASLFEDYLCFCAGLGALSGFPYGMWITSKIYRHDPKSIWIGIPITFSCVVLGAPIGVSLGLFGPPCLFLYILTN